MTGTITRIFPDHGFGFIRAGERDLFFHVRMTDFGDLGFDEGLMHLDVEFDIQQDDRRGKDQAVNVRPRS